MAGVAFGSCLEGQDVVARAAGGVRNRGRRSTLVMPLRSRGRRSTLAMPLPKSWQAQHSVHLGVCLCGRGRIRQLSRGTGCCRARGGGCAISWQAQHFGDAVAKSWQAQYFGDAVAEVVAGAAFMRDEVTERMLVVSAMFMSPATSLQHNHLRTVHVCGHLNSHPWEKHSMWGYPVL